MFLCMLYHLLILCSVQTSQAILTGITYIILKPECFCLCRVKSEWGTSQEKSPEFDVPSQLSSGPLRAQFKTQVLKFYLVYVEVLCSNRSTNKTTCIALSIWKLSVAMPDGCCKFRSIRNSYKFSISHSCMAWKVLFLFFLSNFLFKLCLHLLCCRFSTSPNVLYVISRSWEWKVKFDLWAKLAGGGDSPHHIFEDGIISSGFI